jgi:anaerobic ribonucleoside-triphosphate reductase activating protein
MIKIADVEELSLVDGEGLRLVFFLPGCIHQCPGCHNPGLWDPENFKEYTEKEIKKLLKDNPEIDGVTLSGGDPAYNPENTLKLLEVLNGYNIWMYTGYNINEVPIEILDRVDVLIDGKFIKELPEGLYTGSDNQCIWRKYDKGTIGFENPEGSKRVFRDSSPSD